MERCSKGRRTELLPLSCLSTKGWELNAAAFQMIHHSDLLRRILTLSNLSGGTMTWQLCEVCDAGLMCYNSAHVIPVDDEVVDPAYMTCRHFRAFCTLRCSGGEKEEEEGWRRR